MSFYKNEIESSECDLIDKVYVFHPSDLLAEEDWTDFNISFSKSDKSSIEKMIQLSDVEIGVQFSYRGEVCIKKNTFVECLHNVESSSGFMFLHPSTIVNVIE